MYYVYILTNKSNDVLYTGITGDLKKRIYEHKREEIDGFTKRYHVNKLVYYETHSSPQLAIKREKQIKRWIREKKNKLIESVNPTWKDLYEAII
jgi:putative endonuclease